GRARWQGRRVCELFSRSGSPRDCLLLSACRTLFESGRTLSASVNARGLYAPWSRALKRIALILGRLAGRGMEQQVPVSMALRALRGLIVKRRRLDAAGARSLMRSRDGCFFARLRVIGAGDRCREQRQGAGDGERAGAHPKELLRVHG